MNDRAETGACAAVLLLGFNRPALTQRVLSAIAIARPSRLYVATDGPRPGNLQDIQRCQAVRSLFERIEWPCELKTLHRQQNLGCGMAVRTAIDWFFDHETEGIILEDDCLPDASFFSFCSELLDHLRNQHTVFAISGDNFVGAQTPPLMSYWFNRVFLCWGWATWRDRWHSVPAQITATDEASMVAKLHRVGLPKQDIRYWRSAFSRVAPWTPASKRIDTWDYQVCYHALSNGLLTVCPAVNLVTNIGFGPEALHTHAAPSRHAVCSHALPFPLWHPDEISADRRLTRETMARHFEIVYSPWPFSTITRARQKLSRLAMKLARSANGAR